MMSPLLKNIQIVSFGAVEKQVIFLYIQPYPQISQLQSNMKNIIVVTLLAFALINTASALTCPEGFFDAGGGYLKCTRCYQGFTKCSANNNGTFVSTLSGGTTLPSGLQDTYCWGAYIGGTLYPTFYNKATNNCETACKEGCSKCVVDYDYCLDCTSGYTWNTDGTCLPAVIGLQAAALALLVIALLFLLIGCIYVNKARK